MLEPNQNSRAQAKILQSGFYLRKEPPRGRAIGDSYSGSAVDRWPSAKPAVAPIAPHDTSGAKWLQKSYPEILEFSKIVTYKKRDVIIREGVSANFVSILVKGTAMSYKTAEGGQQKMVLLIQPGQLYGFMTMFSPGENTVTVEALDPCKNLEIDKTRLKQLLLAKPAILWKLTEEIAGGVANYAHLVETQCLTVEERICKSLITLAKQFGHNTADGIELQINLTQEKLAICAGTTRVTTARILSGLIEQGIVRVKPKPWVICRIDSLVKSLTNMSITQPRP